MSADAISGPRRWSHMRVGLELAIALLREDAEAFHRSNCIGAQKRLTGEEQMLYDEYLLAIRAVSDVLKCLE